ncbi:unnamed protein product [Diplocarpon coronariae]
MTPPAKPTEANYFVAKYRSAILLSAFAAQLGHYQYIRRTLPAAPLECVSGFARIGSIPRPLKAGTAWAAVFITLLTQITLAERTIRDYSDPVITAISQRKPWTRTSDEVL